MNTFGQQIFDPVWRLELSNNYKSRLKGNEFPVLGDIKAETKLPSGIVEEILIICRKFSRGLLWKAYLHKTQNSKLSLNLCPTMYIIPFCFWVHPSWSHSFSVPFTSMSQNLLGDWSSQVSDLYWDQGIFIVSPSYLGSWLLGTPLWASRRAL